MVGTALVQAFGPAGALLAYLFYEFHFGRVASLNEQLSSFSGALIALSRNVEGVDEDAVIQSMPDDVVTPSRLYTSEDADEETAQEIADIISEELEKIQDQQESATDGGENT
jgi:hypothetical protein